VSELAVVWVGRRAPAAFEAIAGEYLARLSRRLRVEEIRVRPAEGRGNDPRRALAEEAGRIRRHLAPGDTVVALDEHGRERSTRELARWLAGRLRLGRVVFVIGSDLGLHEELARKAGDALALSRLTLPHALARVLLLEQLYRVSDLWAGGQYHRGDTG
jgi:23S rRNA (pseudouridine1915-N3)-methyltransferase